MSAFFLPESDLEEGHDNLYAPPNLAAQPTWSFPSAHQPDAYADYALDSLNTDSAAWLDNAYPTGNPSPPQPSFLDNILNPVETSSFGYRFGDISMPSSQSQGRPARVSDGFVDLTDDSPEIATTLGKTKRDSATPGPSTKRLRKDDGTAAKDKSPEATVEQIDLSDDKQTVQDVLQKQREEAVKAQAQPDDGDKPTTFNAFNCVICMDTPTDLTATACGRLHTSWLRILADKTRSSVLPHLLDGSPHCWREPRRPRRTAPLPVPRLPKEHQPDQSNRHHSTHAQERTPHTAEEATTR